MEKYDLENIKILSTDDDKKLLNETEQGILHTPYQTEVLFYSCIQQGNVEKVKEYIKNILADNLVIGKLSFDYIRQIKYFAVCCITLGTRYAIQGGLSENEAFYLGDKYIRAIDRFSDPEKILLFLQEKAIEIAQKVNDLINNKDYPTEIRKCLNYINTNLPKKLTVKILAEYCNFSEDYLSFLFKKYMGINLSSYIMKEKLKLAKKMLDEKFNYNDLAYFLSFSSQSHFISRFKNEFGLTPKQYLNKLKY